MMADLMTTQDLKEAAPLSAKILDIVTRERPTTAVAAVACALAAVAHMAGCGTRGAIVMFEYYYKKLGDSAVTDVPIMTAAECADLEKRLEEDPRTRRPTYLLVRLLATVKALRAGPECEHCFATSGGKLECVNCGVLG